MPYRYIGNKTRLIPRLMPVIRSIVKPGAVVADLMCGTASVSEGLRFAGYRVIASDVMTFAAHHAFVRLKLDYAPPFAGLGIGTYLDVLWNLNTLDPISGYMAREYSLAGIPLSGHPARMYFTEENAGKIDAIQCQIRKWDEAGVLTEAEKTLLRHDLVLASNAVANIAGTYGHFRSTWSKGALSPLLLKPSIFTPDFRTDHTVLRGYAEEIAPTLISDLCYIDPPYMKRQYAANYHLLETIARDDEPEAIGVSGLRPWRDQYSDFCSKVKIWDAFAKILEMDSPHFLISYSEDGLIPLEKLRCFFSNFGTVFVKEFRYPRFRSNDSPLGTTVTEYLIHVTKG